MMTVKDLIELLKRYDEDAVVGMADDTRPPVPGRWSETKIYAMHCGGAREGTTLHRRGGRRYRKDGRATVVLLNSDLQLDDGVVLGGPQRRKRDCSNGEHYWHPKRSADQPCLLECLYCWERTESACSADCIHCGKSRERMMDAG